MTSTENRAPSVIEAAAQHADIEAYTLPSVRARRAHAMKNCLSVIGAVIHLVEGDCTGKNTPRLNRAREAIDRLKDYVDEDLDPCSSVPRSRVSVAALCHCVHARVEDIATRRDVRLVVDCAPETGWFHVNVPDLVDALENLVLNALRATTAGGVVTLAAKATAPGRVQIEVRDNGRGMSPSELVRYGAPFVSRFDGGSGIGAVTARHVVELHEGTFEIESVLDIGTKITIRLDTES